MKRYSSWFCLVCLLAIPGQSLGAGPQYKGVILYPIHEHGNTWWINDIDGGQVTGAVPSVYGFSATLWSKPFGEVIDLHPTSLSAFTGFSHATAISGDQQVGYGITPNDHALLWNGSAASAVDLHPTGFDFSRALGTSGTQQVGSAGTYSNTQSGVETHAILWNGTAESAIDLHPTSGFEWSEAVGTDGIRQVGSGYGSQTGGLEHAQLWSGSAGSAIDLHPTNIDGFLYSKALNVSGSEQVGWGHFASGQMHALLWNGSADSTVDLHPTQFTEFVGGSLARDTNGIQQVGHLRNHDNYYSVPHAMLWYGTAESAVDLHLLLPAGFTASDAYEIDASGTIYGIADYWGFSVPYAVMWAPVPEPTTAALASILFLAAIAARNPGHSRTHEGGAHAI